MTAKGRLKECALISTTDLPLRASVIRIIKWQALSRGGSKLIYETDLSAGYLYIRRRRINSRQCGYANRLPSRNSGDRSINRGNKLVFDNITVKALAPGGAARGGARRQKRTSHEAFRRWALVETRSFAIEGGPSSLFERPGSFVTRGPFKPLGVLADPAVDATAPDLRFCFRPLKRGLRSRHKCATIFEFEFTID